MGEEVRADPVELGELGKACTTIGTDLRNGLRGLRERGTLSASVFGNSDRAEELDENYTDAIGKAGHALEDLADVLEGDCDRIYGVAFAYQETDRRNGENIPHEEPPR